MKDNLIMSFESSCDETSVAIIKNGNQILSNIVATQIKSHQRFGGVVPEVASRHHIEEITYCVQDAMKEAGVTYDDLDGIAVTYGPGLVGALLIGVTAAKTIAWAHHLPLIPVNHLAGHIYAANFVTPIKFPAMALVVSGGHTELVLMKKEGSFEIIGETRDDAAGEVYDKIGRVIGIKYPAGPEVDHLAHLGHDVYHFPRDMRNSPNYDFSFSGLKSAFLNKVHHAHQVGDKLSREDLAASFQAAVIDVLLYKTKKALSRYQVKQLILGGGVAANSGLRAGLKRILAQDFPETEFLRAPKQLCGDNAAMIGGAGYVFYKEHKFASLDLNADPGLEFPWIEDAEH